MARRNDLGRIATHQTRFHTDLSATRRTRRGMGDSDLQDIIYDAMKNLMNTYVGYTARSLTVADVLDDTQLDTLRRRYRQYLVANGRNGDVEALLALIADDAPWDSTTKTLLSAVAHETGLPEMSQDIDNMSIVDPTSIAKLPQFTQGGSPNLDPLSFGR